MSSVESIGTLGVFSSGATDNRLVAVSTLGAFTIFDDTTTTKETNFSSPLYNDDVEFSSPLYNDDVEF